MIERWRSVYATNALLDKFGIATPLLVKASFRTSDAISARCIDDLSCFGTLD
jgi:hypothetical protein